MVQYFFFPSKYEGSIFCFLNSFEECQNISGHFVHLWTKYQSPSNLVKKEMSSVEMSSDRQNFSRLQSAGVREKMSVCHLSELFYRKLMKQA